MTGSILGKRVLRKEDPKFLTTGGVYVDDMDEPLLAGAAARDLRPLDHGPRPHHRRSTPRDAAAMPGVVAVFTAADLGLEPVAVAVQPDGGPHRCWPATVVRYVGEPIAAVVTETPRPGRGRRRAGRSSTTSPLEVAASTSRPRWPARTLLYADAGSNVGVRLDRARHARHDRRRVLRRLRGRRHRAARQPARRALPARGARLGRGVGRRPAAPVAVDAARAGRPATSIAAANGVEPDQVRVITPDVGGGFGAKIGAYPEELLLGRLAKRARPAGALARDPQRVDGGARPRPGPGAARHASAAPATARSRLPAARASRTAAPSPRSARSSPRS